MLSTARAMSSKVFNEGHHFDTIVLGAGISGLACASRLNEHKYFDKQSRLLVLEARDRIGGRIGAVSVNGCRLDTGANWIHGIGTAEKPNPLMGILPHKRYRELSGTVIFGVPYQPERDVPSTASDEWVQIASHASAGLPRSLGSDLVVPSSIAGQLSTALWETIGELHEMALSVSADEAKETTILKALSRTESLRNAFKVISAKYHSTLSSLPQFLETMEAAPLTAQSAEHVEDNPGMSLLEFAIEDFDGDQVFLKDGYIAIIEELSKHLTASGTIETGVEVTQVDWSTDPISIQTNKGTYTATNVVCTIPLGVLKHNQKQADAHKGKNLFHPPLPPAKQNAIASLGFGTLDKIFLVYSHPWWTEEPFSTIIGKGFVERPFHEDKSHRGGKAPDSFLGFTSELPGISIHADGTTSTGPQRLSVMNLHALTGYPALSIFVSCASATQIESCTDEQAASLLQRAFTNWFGQEPPKPEGVHVTRWAQDVYSRGSYSHMITGLSETRHREEFQQPAISKGGATLRFAGEHTSRNHFATAHGALISGWREADAILASISASVD